MKITPATKWIDYVQCVYMCETIYLTSAFTGHNYLATSDVAVEINLFSDFFQKYLP